jgi:hypothetical protein
MWGEDPGRNEANSIRGSGDRPGGLFLEFGHFLPKRRQECRRCRLKACSTVLYRSRGAGLRPATPAFQPAADRPGGLSHGQCGTKPIGRGRWQFPKRSQFAKLSAVGAMAWGIDQTKPISGESQRRQRGEWDAGFCETKPISDAFRARVGGGLWGVTMKRRWPAALLKSPVLANAPIRLQGSRRLEQGIPGN